MRRTTFQQPTTLHDEFLINYRQDQQAPIDAFLSIWSTTWMRFQRDICSYIIPAIVYATSHANMVEENTQAANNKNQKHTFSFAYSTRQLKRIIILHSKMDLISQIRKQITAIFYRVANAFVTNCLQNQNKNLYRSVVDIYKKVQSKFDVLIGCLSLVIGKFITRKGIQDEFYSIINKQLINHQQYQYYVNCCMTAVQQYRDLHLKIKNQQGITGIDTIPKIKLLNKLKIFPYAQYIERSKKYYSQVLQKIPKNIWMFAVLYNLIKCQKALQYLIIPDDQLLNNVKQILKNQPWRALEEENIIKIYCKEVLEEIYDDLIQYIDYLVDPQVEHTGKNYNKRDGQQYIVSLAQKKQLLKYLWQLTNLFQKNITTQKTRLLNNKQKHMNPKTKLFNRMTLIAGDILKYINSPHSNNLYKIIQFRDHVLSVIAQCFDNDSKFLNAVTNKMEQIIVEQQQMYNQKLCSIILSPTYKFPGTGSKVFVNNKQDLMIDESEQKHSEKIILNNKCSFQLFKLTPSKQQFIRKFQQQLTSYVIPRWDKNSLCQQQLFIRPIQKQCGYSLSRNIQRMLNDVWRNNQPVYYKFDCMVCKILCQDWPHFAESKYRLADSLVEVRSIFQAEFLSQPENDKKKLKWIEQFGKIQVSIVGVKSIFSQLQASIIMLLSKSYRPIKSRQFKQVLEYKQDDMQGILQDLSNKNIIIYNQDADNYELNYQNKLHYSFQAKQKISTKSQKKSIQKDYTVVVEAYIAKILKRRKSVQKTDLSKILGTQIKIDGHQATIEQINIALQRLRVKQIINIQKTRGIIKYLE